MITNEICSVRRSQQTFEVRFGEVAQLCLNGAGCKRSGAQSEERRPCDALRQVSVTLEFMIETWKDAIAVDPLAMGKVMDVWANERSLRAGAFLRVIGLARNEAWGALRVANLSCSSPVELEIANLHPHPTHPHSAQACHITNNTSQQVARLSQLVSELKQPGELYSAHTRLLQV